MRRRRSVGGGSAQGVARCARCSLSAVNRDHAPQRWPWGPQRPSQPSPPLAFLGGGPAAGAPWWPIFGARFWLCSAVRRHKSGPSVSCDGSGGRLSAPVSWITGASRQTEAWFEPGALPAASLFAAAALPLLRGSLAACKSIARCCKLNACLHSAAGS